MDKEFRKIMQQKQQWVLAFKVMNIIAAGVLLWAFFTLLNYFMVRDG